jgi:hypothetical protein
MKEINALESLTEATAAAAATPMNRIPTNVDAIVSSTLINPMCFSSAKRSVLSTPMIAFDNLKTSVRIERHATVANPCPGTFWKGF